MTASDSALLQRLSLLSGAPQSCMPARGWVDGMPDNGGSATLSAMRSSGQTPEVRARSPKTLVETSPMPRQDGKHTTCVAQRRGHAELPLVVFMFQCPSERHPGRPATQQPPTAPNTAHWSHRRQGT